MTRMNYEDAKAHFDELARKARAGETTVVTQENKPPFTIGPGGGQSVDRPLVKRPDIGNGKFRIAADFNASDYEPRPIRFGLAKDRIRMAPDFNEMSDDEIRAWEGEDDDDPA